MRAFKDAIAADIKGVFINPLEFAEQHNINGQIVTAMVDSDILKERSRPTASEYAEGVFIDEKLVYVAADDLQRKPVEGEMFRLDNRRYIVKEVVDNMGVLEITITANEA